MSWHPNDLVTDADLVAYERSILTQHGASDWQSRRQKALEDWLFPLLEARGFPPHRFRTRFVPESVQGFTSSAYTDRTSASQESDGLNLATILAASTDYLYVGSEQPFRGLSLRMQDNVNAVASALTVRLWQDTFGTALTVTDGTSSPAGTPFAKGGAISWTLPENVVRRSVNSVGPYYWARVSVATALTAGTLAGVLSVIRRSRLCAAVTFRTLSLIFREAPTSQDGPWVDKADFYAREADAAWNRVIDQIGGEFDVDNDDSIDADESDQTSDEVTGFSGFSLERN